MSDSKHISLLDVVQKSLSYANKKSFIHRVIYLISCGNHAADTWVKAIEQSVKMANDEKGCGVGKWDPLACLALVSPKYVIAIFEGAEDVYNKHAVLLRELLQDSQSIRSIKILSYIPHINKRWLIGWISVVVQLPVTLDFTEDSEDPARHAALLLSLIHDLYYVLKFVHEIPLPEFRQRIGALCKICGQYLPPGDLLDLLYDSPLLIPLEDTYDDVVPSYMPDQEKVWPAPLSR